MRGFLVCLGFLVVSLATLAAQDNSGFKPSARKELKPSKDFKPPTKDFKPPRDMKASKDFKPRNDFKPPRDMKASKDFKPSKGFKPPRDFKASKDFKPPKGFKPGRGPSLVQRPPSVGNPQGQPRTLAMGGSPPPPATKPASPTTSEQPNTAKSGRITIVGADSVSR